MSDEVWTEDWVPGNSYESKRNPETARIINKLLRYCLGVNYRLCCYANQAYHKYSSKLFTIILIQNIIIIIIIIVIVIINSNAGLKVYFWLWEHLCDQV